VLLVDDSAPRRQRMRRHLSRTASGVSVCEARDGGDALALAGCVAPTLIISSWNLPELSGVELLRELQRWHSEVPFGFLLPRDAGERVREKAMEVGARFVLHDPASVSTLRALLEHFHQGRAVRPSWGMAAEQAATAARAGQSPPSFFPFTRESAPPPSSRLRPALVSSYPPSSARVRSAGASSAPPQQARVGHGFLRARNRK
jgi:two-component system, chemotaxis family, chemotaxis protein CheY